MEVIRYQNGKLPPYLTISIDYSVPCVIDIWEGPFGTQENFRNGLEKVVETIEKFKLKKWLADLRRMEGSFDSSAEWLANVLMVKAIDAGLLFEAIVLPEDVFSKLSTTDTIKKIGGVEIRQFNNYSKAVEWLTDVKLIEIV